MSSSCGPDGMRKKRRPHEVTPEQAKAHLKAHAKWLRQEINNLKTVRSAVPTEIERLRYVAAAIERFVKGRVASLDDAFGVKRGKGARQKKSEHMALARKAFPLRREGLSWENIASKLSEQGQVPPEGIDAGTIRRAYDECAAELIAEEVAARLDK
jgi:hypothetical protein